MSCFVMNPDSIRRIAYTLADILNASYFSNTCNIATDAVHTSDLAKAFAQYFSPVRGYNAEGIAEDLYSLNQRAYNGRYLVCMDCDFLPPPNAGQAYSIRRAPCVTSGREHPQPWHYHLLKLLDCYLYQTAEDATSADPLRKVIHSFNTSLMGRIVRCSAAYAVCEWGK